MMTTPAGKVALILGAGTEPGSCLARKFAAWGMVVVLLDRDAASTAAIAADIVAKGGTARTQEIFGDSAADVRRCIDEVLRREGCIDVFINNTFRFSSQPLEALTPARLDEIVGAVLQAPYAYLQAAVLAMRERGFGRVVNITNIDYLGLPGKAGVAAAQAGVFGLNRAMALEVARDNITINNLVLGDIIAEGVLSDEETSALASGIPVKRVGSLADVANAVAFFVDEKTRYVTGQTFFVCGGKSVYFSMSV